MNKVDTAKWKEFIVGELFPQIIKPFVYHTKDVVKDEEGIPYVVRSKFNNGIKYRVLRPREYVNPARVISFGAENSSFFYQKEEWISGRDMYYIDVTDVNEYACLFIATCLQPIAAKYSYNFGLFPDLLKKEVLKLPVDQTGRPDFLYMETYMKNRAVAVSASLTALQSAKQLQNSKKLNTLAWKPFGLGELFEVKKGKRLTKAGMIEGNIRFIGASAVNNGITAYIGNDEHIHKSNVITINYNGSVGEAFYQEKPFWASDDVNVLYPKFILNQRVAMFFIPILKKVGQKYAFIDKWKKEDMEKEKIMLPVQLDGTPDFHFMENYTRGIELKVQKTLKELQPYAISKE